MAAGPSGEPDGGGSARLSLVNHRPVEALLGLVLILLPFLLSYGPGQTVEFSLATIVAGGAIGMVMTMLAIAGSRNTRAPVSASGHALLDRLMVVALVIVAAILATQQQSEGALFLAGAAIVYGVLVLATRYAADE